MALGSRTRRHLILSLGVTSCVAVLTGCGRAPMPLPEERTIFVAATDLVAIEILIEPDKVMAETAEAVNKRLRRAYPSGFAHDDLHRPHITLLQRYVRKADLGAVAAAVAVVLERERAIDLRLRATGYGSGAWGDVGVLVFEVANAPLSRLQQGVADAVRPYAVRGGGAEAFAPNAGHEISLTTIRWVEDYVPAASGPNFVAHLVLGVAPTPVLDDIMAEPFESFTFSPKAVALYQLGDFGATQRRLWTWEGERIGDAGRFGRSGTDGWGTRTRT